MFDFESDGDVMPCEAWDIFLFTPDAVAHSFEPLFVGSAGFNYSVNPPRSCTAKNSSQFLILQVQFEMA